MKIVPEMDAESRTRSSNNSSRRRVERGRLAFFWIGRRLPRERNGKPVSWEAKLALTDFLNEWCDILGFSRHWENVGVVAAAKRRRKGEKE